MDALLNDTCINGVIRVVLAVGVSLVGSMIVGVIGQLYSIWRHGSPATARNCTSFSAGIDIILTWVVVGVIIGGVDGPVRPGPIADRQDGERASLSVRSSRVVLGGAVGGLVGGFFLRRLRESSSN